MCHWTIVNYTVRTSTICILSHFINLDPDMKPDMFMANLCKSNWICCLERMLAMIDFIKSKWSLIPMVRFLFLILTWRGA